ncbi:ABC transporter substrate-binding protein [Azospirillum sp. ST 5-10]|uniref:ABC transporter substrate-binding protein n=1 Tax=unclassified Azospirillum TaxID=2630922 RepID=UPI003F4A5C20
MRIVTTSWHLAELLLTIGVVPTAISETATYRDRLPEPALPDGVVDLGAVWEPNLELLQRLAPDLILLPPEQTVNAALLGRIAPTRVVPEAAGIDRLAAAERTWRTVAGWLGRADAAEDAIARCRARFARARDALAGQAHRPVYLADIRGGGRLVDVYGPGNILHDALTGVGLRNAWTAPVEAYGWISTGLERLGDPQARLICLGDGADGRRALRRMQRSSLWRALPMVRAGRVTAIPAVFVWGGLATASRLADLLAEATLRPAASAWAGDD